MEFFISSCRTLTTSFSFWKIVWVNIFPFSPLINFLSFIRHLLNYTFFSCWTFSINNFSSVINDSGFFSSRTLFSSPPLSNVSRPLLGSVSSFCFNRPFSSRYHFGNVSIYFLSNLAFSIATFFNKRLLFIILWRIKHINLFSYRRNSRCLAYFCPIFKINRS